MNKYYEIKYKDGRCSDYCASDEELIRLVCDLRYGYGLEQGVDFEVIEKERV